LAIIAYVTILGTLNNSYWQLFIFAVPVSCIVGIIFSSIWGKARITFMLITTLIWSTLTSIYLIFVNENLWFIFLIGIPLQIGTLLWANISSNIKDKKSQTKEDNT